MPDLNSVREFTQQMLSGMLFKRLSVFSSGAEGCMTSVLSSLKTNPLLTVNFWVYQLPVFKVRCTSRFSVRSVTSVYVLHAKNSETDGSRTVLFSRLSIIMPDIQLQ